jgi:hypothetical protein
MAKRIFLASIFILLLTSCLRGNPAEDWATPSEKSNYKTTPNYAETMEYLKRIANAAKGKVKLEPFGKSGLGRILWTVLISGDGVFDPESIHRANRPVVLIQNGIHAGEIDGKDASLALIRDMVIKGNQKQLLQKAVIVIIPIYNIDGHERISRYNRINQNGPEEMGWRTTAINLNLNRDYMKADTPETRAFLKLWNRWVPDFLFDDHVTDGADYQYDITYGVEHGPDVNPPLASWIEKTLMPDVEKSVSATGHRIGPLINFIDPNDPASGLTLGQSPPRFSTGYAILQNRPGMLVEMHMLKDYKTRVTGNYEILRATLEVINRDADPLIQMNRNADAATIIDAKNGATVALYLDPSGETEPFEFLTYKYRIEKSDLSDGPWVQYSKEPLSLTVKRQTACKVSRSVQVPAAYAIPPQWTRLIDVIQAHGLKILVATKPFTTNAEVYRCKVPVWTSNPFEGRHPVSFSGVAMGDAGFHNSGFTEPGCKATLQEVSYPAGTVIVPTAQRSAKVAVHFLEPDAPDSAVVWGFVDAIFEQKEYGEGYVLEKMAREMIEKDPKLKQEFDQEVANDKTFASSPDARLNFFYQHSPYWDHQFGVYPVARLKSLEGIPK